VTERSRPKLAVWKFASCDGCQLSLLNLEHELLDIADAVDIAYFRTASSKESLGPFDISIADGSITTAHDIERLREVRARSRFFVSLGACATSGGIQALRNFTDVDEYRALNYPSPEYVETLATSTGFAEHVPVDFELRGCPVDKRQLLEVISAFLHGRKPVVPAHSVCVECKLRDNVCVMVTGTPCLGPVTHAGCRALCPSVQRGCYGCYGPMEAPNTASMAQAFRDAGKTRLDVLRVFRTYNANAPAFRRESEAHAADQAVKESDT
jgi:coenzyme F420-reducing hydrogenase gamma subunit